jgi:acyl dehydratase
MIAKNKKFEEIKNGESASFKKTITEKDLTLFAEVSGDFNPLHLNVEYANGTEFHGRIIHGMFLGALVSRFIGMELPGKKALLLKESLEFKKPAKVGDTLTIKGTVAHKSSATRILEILMEINTKKELLVSGTVFVRVLP